MARRGLTGVLTRAYGACDHDAEVVGVERLAPHFIRVHLSAPSMVELVEDTPTAWLRFWFPDARDPGREEQRGYTISSLDKGCGTLSVDGLLHQPSGPASSWLQNASAGNHISVTSLGSSRFVVPQELPAGYLLAGDAASVPAINSLLDAIPEELPIELYLEDCSPHDRLIPLHTRSGVSVHRVTRVGEQSLAEAIERRDWSNWEAWAATESGTLRHLRTCLRDSLGFSRQRLCLRAYWYEGRAFGSRRRREPA